MTDQLCMDQAKMQDVVRALTAVHGELAGVQRPLAGAVRAANAGFGGANDKLAAAFATAYFPAADQAMTTAQSVPDHLAQLVASAQQSMQDYQQADHAGAQCFPR